MWEDGKAGDYMLTPGGNGYPDQNMVGKEDNNGLNVKTFTYSRWTLHPSKSWERGFQFRAVFFKTYFCLSEYMKYLLWPPMKFQIWQNERLDLG